MKREKEMKTFSGTDNKMGDELEGEITEEVGGRRSNTASPFADDNDDVLSLLIARTG